MKFFKLGPPKDSRGRRANPRPIVVRMPYAVPAIECPECGVAIRVAHIRGRLPSDLSEFELGRRLPVREWNRRRDRWASALGVTRDRVVPGATIGPPMGNCVKPMKSDVAWPFPGLLWVNSRIRDALLSAGGSGFSFSEVKLDGKCGDLRLWEIAVTGHAWRKGMTPESSIECRICGLVAFPEPRRLSVDVDRWDGSDWFTLDYNQSIILVTQKAARVLLKLDVTGLSMEAIE